MAFVVLHGEDGYAAWARLSLSLGYAHTALAGRGGRPVLALPDTALDELARRGVPFTALPEAQLPEHLSEGGLAYYRLLREHHPELLDFDAALPRALHVAMSCTVPEPYAEALRQIVQRYQPAEYRTVEVAVARVPATSGEPAEVRPMVRADFTVPRAHRQALVDELIASGVAGTSRETAVYVLSDPDGPRTS
jgi:hypothetical protein